MTPSLEGPSRRVEIAAIMLCVVMLGFGCVGPVELDFTGDWMPLFNGENLDGWVEVNCAPSTFTVRDGMIVCSGKPTGVLRTARRYENFELELEWRHTESQGNAGLFIWSDPITARGQPFTRSIEVQILDGLNTENYTSHGDIFAIHGATMAPARPHPAGWMRCLPDEERCRPFGEWNHYRVTCFNGMIALAVNGKGVSGGLNCSPREGYICLESEGSEVHFRNLRIRELLPIWPSADPGDVAEMARDFRTLFNGVDLSGWREGSGLEGHWTVNDWVLAYDGEGETLWTQESFGDFELIADWRWTAEPVEREVPIINFDGSVSIDSEGQERTARVLDAGDSGLLLRGSDKAQVNIWCWPIGSGEVFGYRTDASLAPEVRAAVTPWVAADAPLGDWNRFHITLIGDRLDVVLNGKTVIEDAQLPGLPERGPLGLQHHGSPIEFANLYVRRMP